MIVTVNTMNKKFLTYCKNKNISPLDENNLKAYLDLFMTKNKFIEVHQQGNNFKFK
jgi:hypothetical protein